MAQQGSGMDPIEHGRQEERRPENPPNSVLGKSRRKAALSTYIGGLVAFFLICGMALMYWSARGTGSGEPAEGDHRTVGTAGERSPEGGREPGGMNPDPDHDSTRDEIEFRGGGEPSQGPNPALSTTAPLTELGAALEDSPRDVAGRRIDLKDVDVDSAQGNVFWVRDGSARAQVVGPAGTEVRTGQRVNVTGTVEADGGGSTRIRADRVDVR